MDVSELISPERISCDAQDPSKKRVLEHLSNLLATSTPNLTPTEIFSSLIDRERLGSTALGHGVALPHGRLHGREQAVGAFIKLKEGINYDAMDKQPVDLFYALLVPDHFTDEHLKIISKLAEMFNNDDFRDQIRQCHSDEQLYSEIVNACKNYFDTSKT